MMCSICLLMQRERPSDAVVNDIPVCAEHVGHAIQINSKGNT